MSLNHRIRALSRAVLPRSLRHQMLVLMLGVTAMAMVVLDGVSRSRFDDAAVASSEDTARSLARLPGMMRLVVLDAQGAPHRAGR